MSELKPGLYRATVRGVADQIVMVCDWSYSHRNITQAGIDHNGVAYDHGHRDADITDARPLIVLDLNTSEVEYVVDVLRQPRYSDEVSGSIARIADQIEAQIKPARIPEPGLWGVVEAIYQVVSSTRQLWVNDGHGWTTLGVANAYHVASFAQLIDPTLIREGVN